MKDFFLLMLMIFYGTVLFAKEDSLSQLVAQNRKKQISKVSYDLLFEFEKKLASFNGLTTITVELNHFDSPLRIDSTAKEIKKVEINSKEIKDFKKEDGLLEIPRKYLEKKNIISISYKADFNPVAFKRYFDELDKSSYFYSHLEPYGAHTIFPCFDQPDLKATYLLSVKAPKEWKILHNEPELSKTSDGQLSLWKFKQTPFLSTYLFFLGGGDFVEWSDTYQKLPLKIYSRKSIAKNVDPKNIFDSTKKGLKFFTDYFDMPYPFSKYDHIFVPDFAYSGMENPGAITMNEKFIFEGNATNAETIKRDDLIYHEMAHIWFGDLVTMEWWNDLWLNESFASYFASLAIERISMTKKNWMFFLNSKRSAYGEDLFSNTSHPIVGEVPDTISATGSFDAITYSKGAASLKQLHFLVGEEAFKKGISSYFKKFAFKNTTLRDFITSIDEHTELKLDSWVSGWLLSSGPSPIKYDFTCKDDRIETFTINQASNHSGILLPHKTSFAFYALKNQKLKFLFEEGISFQNSVTQVPSLKGKVCPDFILPNFSDFDYGHFTLDDKSMKVVTSAIESLQDPLSRFQLWILLEQKIKDGLLTPEQYFKIIESALKVEDDAELISLIQGVGSFRNTTFRDPFLLFLTKDQRKVIAPRLEKIIFNRLINSPPDSNLRLTFFNLYLLIARSPESQVRLFQYITSGKGPPHLNFSQALRWSTLQNLSTNKHPKALELNAFELKRDPSFEGRKMELVVRSSFPDAQMKVDLWKFYFYPWPAAYTIVREGTDYIHNVEAPELSRPHLQKYFEESIKTNWNQNMGLVDYNFYRLFPVQVCTQEALDMSLDYLKKKNSLNSFAKRRWLLSQNELAQCVSIRKKQVSSNHFLK